MENDEQMKKSALQPFLRQYYPYVCTSARIYQSNYARVTNFY